MKNLEYSNNSQQPETIMVRKFDHYEWEEISYEEYVNAENLAGSQSAFAETRPVSKLSFFDIEKKGNELATMLSVYAEQNDLHTSVTAEFASEHDTAESFTFHVFEGNMLIYSVPVSPE
jgi:hypothetical protein